MESFLSSRRARTYAKVKRAPKANLLARKTRGLHRFLESLKQAQSAATWGNLCDRGAKSASSQALRSKRRREFTKPFPVLAPKIELPNSFCRSGVGRRGLLQDDVEICSKNSLASRLTLVLARAGFFNDICSFDYARSWLYPSGLPQRIASESISLAIAS